jgi:prepilin-type N-terminal cleavage/methylation domain-containing protein
MTMDEQDRTDEDGFTLVEVLLAVVILGIAVVTFVSGLAAAIRSSDLHRKDATIQTVLRNYAEALQASASSCPGSLSPSYSAPAGYSVSPSSLACPTAGSPATIQVTASSADGRATDTYTIVVRAR